MRIGVAGYMGAGKSTAARMISGAAGRLIDADAEAKVLMNGSAEIKGDLVAQFGGSVVQDGRILFGELGARVFESLDNLQRLNAIVHPHLVVLLHDKVRRAGDCVLDAALIPLWRVEHWFDICLWVRSSREIRVRRVAAQTRQDPQRIVHRAILQERLFTEPNSDAWRMIINESSIEDLASMLEKTQLTC
jgi:dephospho-CoA kinase